MENSDAPLTGVDSFQIIQQMIDTAKREQKDDGKGWILWGWTLLLASISTVLNLRFHWVPVWAFWNIFGGLTLLFCFIKIVVRLGRKNKQAVKTYAKDLLDKLNMGFFISLMFIILSMNVNDGVNPMRGFPLLMSLYGFWVLIYGSVLNFKPSIIGALATWVFAFVALFVTTFSWVMMLHAAAVLCGYIIPGHLANREFKKHISRKSTNQESGV